MCKHLVRFFENRAQNLNTPQNNSASWGLQMGFNMVFKGLRGIPRGKLGDGRSGCLGGHSPCGVVVFVVIVVVLNYSSSIERRSLTSFCKNS